MQLSAEQFEKILSALRSDAPLASAKDKRRRPRVGLRATVSIVETSPRGQGVRAQATLRDISREGLGLQRASGMKVGSRFLVQFSTSDGQPQSILCTVRHSESVADATWHIGATFIRLCNVNPVKKDDIAPMNADEAAAEIEAAGPTPVEPSREDTARIRKAILS
jgi:hypothetical protein